MKGYLFGFLCDHLRMYRGDLLWYIQFFILIELVKPSRAHLISKMLCVCSLNISIFSYTGKNSPLRFLFSYPPQPQISSADPGRRVWFKETGFLSSSYPAPSSWQCLRFIYSFLSLFFSQTPVKLLLGLKKKLRCKHKFDILCSSNLWTL